MNPLTAAQQGIWAGHLMAADKALYNTAECLFFSGKIDPELLEDALRMVIRESDFLCSHYLPGPDNSGARRPAAPEFSLARLTPDDGEVTPEAVRRWAQTNDLIRSFDLASELPCRFTLFEGKDRDALYIAAHHIALDGFGYGLFAQRLAELYKAMGEGTHRPGRRFGSAGDVEAEYRSIKFKDQADAGRNFWQEKLLSAPEPPVFGKPAQVAPGYQRILTSMPAELWANLNELTKEAGATWLDAVFAALSLLLHEHTGERSVVFGVPVMNRIGSVTANVPCTQMNIIPLAMTVGKNETLLSLTRQAASERKQTRRFQNYRHEDMHRDLQKAGKARRVFGPVVNVVPFLKELDFGSFKASRETVSAGPVLDLTLVIHYESPKIPPVFEYCAHDLCLPQAALADIARDVEDILKSWSRDPSLPAASLSAARLAAQRETNLFTGEPLPASPRSFFGGFEDAARTTPDRIAIEQGERRLTCRQLLEVTDRWADALIRRDIAPGMRVAVMIDRSIESVLAALAVMRAGACYVPLDPGQSSGRHKDILESSDIACLITGNSLGLPAKHVIKWQELDAGSPSGKTALLHSGEPATEAAAYMMFTSGSTGRPKGVVVSTAALTHFVNAVNTRYEINSDDRVLQFAPFHFDTSIEEIFVSLASGARLVLRDEKMMQSFAAFAEGVDRLKISVLDLPTAFWNEWVEALSSGHSFLPDTVRTVILGGEAVHPEVLKKWFSSSRPEVRLINSYGPTETTVVTATALLTKEHASSGNVPVGKPLPGVSMLMAGPGGKPGIEGELIILGPTVGLHYTGTEEVLNQPLTTGSRLMPAYRTGDRVRREGQDVIFLGRIDDEFKISGQRIHPHEVESHLLRVPGVSEAAVCGIDEGGRKRLAAFVSGPDIPATDELRRILQASLPPAMIPGIFRPLDALPKTSSGKINRTALVSMLKSEPSPAAAGEGAGVFERVRAIWQKEFATSDIAPTDHFFQIGGESLQALQLALRLAQAFLHPVDVADVLQFPVLADFCRHLEHILTVSSGSENRPFRLTALPSSVRSPVLYAIPGIAGSSAQFLALGASLGGKVRIQVIEPDSGFSAGSAASVAELARAGADLIHAYGGCHYRLAGHSFGGCLAFEIARILAQRGVKVDLWLLDTFLHLERGGIDAGTFLQAATQGLDTNALPHRLSKLRIEWQLKLLADYKPQGSFQGSVWRVFATESGSHHEAAELALAKKLDARLFTGPQKILAAPGNHFTMLSDRHAGVLAGLMSAVISPDT